MDLMSDDVKNGVIGFLGRRFSSPVVMNFAIAWCIWNYKFLVILFSKNSVTETFSLIDLHYQGFWYSILFLIFIPLASASFYVWVVPILDLVVMKYQWRRDIKEKEEKYNTYKTRVISGDEAARLHDEMKLKDETISQLEHSVYLVREEVKIRNLEVAAVVEKNEKLVADQEASVAIISELNRISSKWKADYLSAIHSEFSDLDAAKYSVLRAVGDHGGKPNVQLHIVTSSSNINYAWLVNGGFISVASGEKVLTDLGKAAMEFWEAKSNSLGN